MIKHVSVFTLKDKSEIKHFVEMLEEVGKNCPLIIKSEVGVNISEQPPVGPHFGDVIQIVEFSNLIDLQKYPQSKEHQKLLMISAIAKYGDKISLLLDMNREEIKYN